jgi:hypothetical protein
MRQEQDPPISKIQHSPSRAGTNHLMAKSGKSLEQDKSFGHILNHKLVREGGDEMRWGGPPGFRLSQPDY